MACGISGLFDWEMVVNAMTDKTRIIVLVIIGLINIPFWPFELNVVGSLFAWSAAIWTLIVIKK